MLRLHLLLDQPYAGGEGHVLAVQGAGRAAVEQPGAQLPLLSASHLDDLLRLVRAALDHGQRLQHRVVHPRGHVRPFLGPDPGPALLGQVPGDAQPPGTEQDRGTDEHEHGTGHRPQHRQALVAVRQEARTHGQEKDRDRHAQPDPAPRPARGQAEQRRGDVPQRGLLVEGSIPQDQHQASGTQDQRPLHGAQEAGAEVLQDQDQHEQHGRQADCERNAPLVRPGLAPDAAVHAKGRHQQPCPHVEDGHKADGDQAGNHDHQPHDRYFKARPGGQSGRNAAEQAVVGVTAQRPLASRPARPARGPAPESPRAGVVVPGTPVIVPGRLRCRRAVGVLASRRSLRPGGLVLPRRAAWLFLHVSIIAPDPPARLSGQTPDLVPGLSGFYRGSSRYPRHARDGTLEP